MQLLLLLVGVVFFIVLLHQHKPLRRHVMDVLHVGHPRFVAWLGLTAFARKHGCMGLGVGAVGSLSLRGDNGLRVGPPVRLRFLTHSI